MNHWMKSFFLCQWVIEPLTVYHFRQQKQKRGPWRRYKKLTVAIVTQLQAKPTIHRNECNRFNINVSLSGARALDRGMRSRSGVRCAVGYHNETPRPLLWQEISGAEGELLYERLRIHEFKMDFSQLWRVFFYLFIGTWNVFRCVKYLFEVHTL